MAVTAIRLILTTALLYFVYGETGKWTVITLTLITLAMEIETALRRHSKG